MKIGILTFHLAHNYGAMLQAYALQTYLRDKGHDARMIDYRPTYITRVYKRFLWTRWISLNPIRCMYKFLFQLLKFGCRCRRYARFAKFERTRLLHWPYQSEQDLSGLDLILLGSDQIWTKGITGGRNDDLYWGLSVPDSIPVASYAASARKIAETDEERAYIRRALDHLQAISVRELSLKEKLSPLSTKPIEHVVDPTLLVDAKAYEPLLHNSSIPAQPYVLVYQVESNKSLWRIAEGIATKLGCRVVEIGAYADVSRTSKASCLSAASPEEFLAYIQGARYVVTSSFHGTALSVVFHRPFCTVRLNSDIDERATSLLSAVGLENRMIDKTGEAPVEDIDYRKVQSKVEDLRRYSQDYIGRVITIANKKNDARR